MNSKMVECSVCGKNYERRVGTINEALRNGWKFYCSNECCGKFKTKKVKLNCNCCGGKIKISRSSFNRSDSKMFFCSKSCSAKFNNKNRKHNQQTRNKISESLQARHKNLNRECICKGCGRTFNARIKTHRIFCSKRCESDSKKYSLEDTIKKFFELKDKLERIPTSKDINSMMRCSVRSHFGKWNKFISELGFQPNVKWMMKKNLKCKDGHFADSISELVVDNWLFKNNIKHDRRKKYPEGNYDCDFYLTEYGIWMEYFGLYGSHKDYDKTVDIKRDMMAKYGCKTIELFSHHLYPVCKLNEVVDLSKQNKLEYKQLEFDFMDN